MASGWAASDVVYQDRHWDETHGGITNYMDLYWDRVLTDDQVLPLDDLKANASGFPWQRVQASGFEVRSPVDEQLERLWGAHVGTPEPMPGAGQGWQADPDRRAQVELHAQRLLEDHFRDDGWVVEDTHIRNPIDAVARRNGSVRYLEAKGTVTDGSAVSVTAGDVTFARLHRGECVLGIVSGLRFLPDGQLDPHSGQLTLHDWDPDKGLLTPISYAWRPPAE